MKIFPAVYLVNTNRPKERVQVLLSKKELNELPEKRPNIFKKSNFDCYMARPSVTFCNGKYNITLVNKSSKTDEYQSYELDDNLI